MNFVLHQRNFLLPLLQFQEVAVSCVAYDDSASRSLGAAERGAVLGFLAQNSRRVYMPALILTGLLGFGLQGMSDSVWKFSQTWIWLALLIWVAMNGVLHAMLLPAEKALAGGDESARKRVDTGGMIMTVLLIVILYLMVFKPGSPF